MSIGAKALDLELEAGSTSVEFNYTEDQGADVIGSTFNERIIYSS